MTDLTKERLGSARAAMARHNRIHRSPVSSAELEARTDARAKPVLETHLSPGGDIEHVVRQRLDADNEQRIGFIQKRLARMEDRAKRAFQRAR